ncbi:thioredoxin family protein [Belliella sp. DSM 111904]|uniref:Thioredoxin family protein n=1 Tax=Belliella filtrata TaxID=2923435 RepID=A0ABS9UYE5_9BACT|nr:thioredoxin family protein [Belliella filtrata]MCH7408969.1 thioredoxin family protein [Belliella filtrata]
MKKQFTLLIIPLCSLFFLPLLYGQEKMDPVLSEGFGEPAVIYVEIKSRNPVSAIKMTIWEHYLDRDTGIPEPEVLLVEPSEGNVFAGTLGSFTYNLTTPSLKEKAYLSISEGKRLLWDRFHVFPGDTVKVVFDMDHLKVLFLGPDAASYRCQHELAVAKDSYHKSLQPVMFTADQTALLSHGNNEELYHSAKDNADEDLHKLMKFIQTTEDKLDLVKEKFDQKVLDHPGFRVIENYKDLIPPDFSLLLQADLTGEVQQMKLAAFNRLATKHDGFKEIYENDIQSLNKDFFPVPIVVQSSEYLNYLLEIVKSNYKMREGPLDSLLLTYPSPIKDILVAKFYVKYHRSIEDIDARLSSVLGQLSEQWVIDELTTLLRSKQKGAPFKDVLLVNQQGEPFFISELKNKAVFIDFWFTGCKACINFYETSIKPLETKLKDNQEVVFVSINVDRNKSTWEKSVETGRYTSPEAINLYIGEQREELLSHYHINAFPSQILLDKQGNLYRAGNLPKSVDELEELINKTLIEGDPENKSMK